MTESRIKYHGSESNKKKNESLKPSRENMFIIHSGNDNVGGITIEVISSEIGQFGYPSIFLDFGARLDISGRFGLSDASYHSGLLPLFLLGAVPPIGRVYRPDLLRNLTLNQLLERIEEQPSASRPINPVALKEFFTRRLTLNPDPKAVAVSHYHWDHIGNIPFLNADISLVGSQITFEVIQAMERHWSANWQREVTAYRDRSNNNHKNGRSLPLIPRNLIPIVKGAKLKIGEMKIYYNQINHSALDSSAISVYLPNGQKIDYTGDIRAGPYTESYVHKLKEEPPTILILDGTNVGSDKPTKTEDQCAQEILNFFQEKEGPIFVMTPQRHFERWSNIIRAAQLTDREVYVPLIIGFYIKELQSYRHLDYRIPDINDVSIFLHPQGTGRYQETDYPVALRETAFNPSLKIINFDGLRDRLPKNPVVILTSQTQLFHLFSHNLLPSGGHYIHSASEAYEEKGRVDLNRLKRILKVVGYQYNLIHSSGHFSEHELYQFLKSINLENIYLVIPLHTLYPQRVAGMIKDISPKTKILTRIRRGYPYNLYGQYQTS